MHAHKIFKFREKNLTKQTWGRTANPSASTLRWTICNSHPVCYFRHPANFSPIEPPPAQTFFERGRSTFSPASKQRANPILHLGGSHVKREQKTQGIHQKVPLGTFYGLYGRRSRLGGQVLRRLGTLEVRDGRCWLGILTPARFLSAALKALRIRVHNPFSQNLLEW